MDPNNLNYMSTWEFANSRIQELSRVFTLEAWLDRVLEYLPDYVTRRTLAVVWRFKLDCASTNIYTRLDEMPSPIPDQYWLDEMFSKCVSEDEQYQAAVNHLADIEIDNALLIFQYYLPSAFSEVYTVDLTPHQGLQNIQTVDDAIHLIASRRWSDILFHAERDLRIVAGNPPDALWPPFHEAVLTLCDMMQWRNTTVFCAVLNLGFLVDRPRIHWLDLDNDEEDRRFLAECMVRDIHLLDHLGPESRKIAAILRRFAPMIIAGFVEPLENVFSVHDDDRIDNHNL